LDLLERMWLHMEKTLHGQGYHLGRYLSGCAHLAREEIIEIMRVWQVECVEVVERKRKVDEVQIESVEGLMRRLKQAVSDTAVELHPEVPDLDEYVDEPVVLKPVVNSESIKVVKKPLLEVIDLDSSDESLSVEKSPRRSPRFQRASSVVELSDSDDEKDVSEEVSMDVLKDVKSGQSGYFNVETGRLGSNPETSDVEYEQPDSSSVWSNSDLADTDMDELHEQEDQEEDELNDSDQLDNSDQLDTSDQLDEEEQSDISHQSEVAFEFLAYPEESSPIQRQSRSTSLSTNSHTEDITELS
jgi:hypothetical protein